MQSVVGTLALVVSATGCQGPLPQLVEKPCVPDQDEPYASGIPYLGIHADAGNSDVIACESADAFDVLMAKSRGRPLGSTHKSVADHQARVCAHTHAHGMSPG